MWPGTTSRVQLGASCAIAVTRMKAVLLLLLAVGTAAAPHVNFLQFSQNGKPSGVRSAIGYPIEVLEFAWRKYGSRLIRAVHRYPGFTVVV